MDYHYPQYAPSRVDYAPYRAATVPNDGFAAYSGYDYYDPYAAAYSYPQQPYSYAPVHPHYGGESVLSEKALRGLDTAPYSERPKGDRASSASRRSSVGSQWAGVTANGPYSRIQRQNQMNSGALPQGWVPKPTGRRLAMCIGIDPARSKASSNSIKHMYNFLRRNNYTVETIIFDGNEDQFEQDIEEGIDQLITQTEAGDSVVFHLIGYGAFRGQDAGNHVGRLVSGLNHGVKLTVFMDSCFADAVRGAYTISHNTPASRRKGEPRLATSAGRALPVGANVFMFQGNASHGNVGRFDSRDGQACVFTSALILSLNEKDTRSSAHLPPSYAQLERMINTNCHSICSKIPKQYSFQMHIVASCGDEYDIDQPSYI